jgi:hypothetical protein
VLEGYVRVAQSTCGGEGQALCTAAGAATGNLFGLYLEAGREEAAAVVKLAGSVSVDRRYEKFDGEVHGRSSASVQ